MKFNTEYLNRTVNTTPRPPSERYIAIIWHETQNGSGNPHSTLKWNLAKKAGSSYDFLIARDGEIFQYLDYHQYISWDSGESEWTIDGTHYRNWALNSVTLGVELDGPADGTPATDAQLDSAARLAVFLRDTENIPLDRAHHLTHAEIARKRTTNKRTDPRGYTPEQVIARARVTLLDPDWPALWGPHARYNHSSGIAQKWRGEHQSGRTLGKAVTEEYTDALGRQVQVFEGGVILWAPSVGAWVWR